jgi:hypothetical protein
LRAFFAGAVGRSEIGYEIFTRDEGAGGTVGREPDRKEGYDA